MVRKNQFRYLIWQKRTSDVSVDATVNLSLKSLEASKINKIGTQSIAPGLLKTVFTSTSGIQVSSPDQ